MLLSALCGAAIVTAPVYAAAPAQQHQVAAKKFQHCDRFKPRAHWLKTIGTKEITVDYTVSQPQLDTVNVLSGDSH